MSARKTTQGKSARVRLDAATRRFAADCSGATAIEYALAAAILGIAVAASVSQLSGAISEMYGRVIALFP